MGAFQGVYFAPDGPKTVCRDFLHLWEDVPLKADILQGTSLVQICLEFLIIQFVARFILSIVFAFFLHRVIREVDQPVLQILEVKFAGRGTDVAFFVREAFEVAIDGGKHSVGANVKFSLVNQKRILYVLLNDASTILFFSSFGHQPLNILILFCHVDAVSTIGILAWLYYPDVPLRLATFCFLLCSFFDQLRLICFKSLEFRVVYACFHMKSDR